ncbi:MAG: UDP-N-acetylmuramate dehydrogenase [Treponema sp.]|nr:UDP-N-acetylmuramate dehydrogenase [Treponema sp.]
MDKYSQLIEYLQGHDAFKGKILENEPIAPKTTFKIGGTARLFIAPENYISFQFTLSYIVKENIKFFILGGGSNIVFTDGQYDGVVLSTQEFNDAEIFPFGDIPQDFGKFTFAKNQILVTCFSGTPMATLVNFCTKNDISGMEQFAGLPGTVGGAVFMNARCFDKSISDVIFYTTHMDYSTPEVTLHHTLFDSSKWDYKVSPFQNNKSFITTVTFLLTKKWGGEQLSIAKECKKYIAERVDKGHFKFPSAGSVFKNNHEFGKPSGKIIDEAGLKGYTFGGAKIADFHGNFIINTGNAKATDIKELVSHTQKIVNEKFGFLLEPEIIFVDN